MVSFLGGLGFRNHVIPILLESILNAPVTLLDPRTFEDNGPLGPSGSTLETASLLLEGDSEAELKYWHCKFISNF